jgi:TolA-binding protein
MANPQLFTESHNDYLFHRIQSIQDQLLAAQQKVNRLRVQLNNLKRQENAQSDGRQKHLTEIFIRS